MINSSSGVTPRTKRCQRTKRCRDKKVSGTDLAWAQDVTNPTSQWPPAQRENVGTAAGSTSVQNAAKSSARNRWQSAAAKPKDGG